jgi:chaperonin GroES
MAIIGGGFETSTRVAHTERPIRPYGARVLVVPDIEAETTAGGIVKPATARGLEFRGTVIAVGPGTLRKDGTVRPLDVQVGDVVLFNVMAGKFAGTEVVLEDGRKGLVVLEDDIIAVVES